ncbi:MAG: sigma-70 family RNA polymerase sigma factor [Candidatus Moranbacteria bacterium]|nr:sigma-70 family RNA polymerase sigma factor [Candidatus Moranbacteria bacterium]MDD3965191.1 sigma-70 family RNA polymerase sigma factor [Candidatus Moranbacteria bacterium]
MDENENLTDEVIVEKVRSLDQELYVVIVDRYQGKLLRYAMSLIRDEHASLDIVQESFIKAFVNLQSFDTKKKFSSWIYRIVHNEAMNVIKKYRKEMPILDDIDFPSDENIAEDFEQQEITETVKKCLEKMPILYSEPLALRYIEEKSYEEISDILHIPLGTVATRINRAKIVMKRVCQKN